MSWFGFFRGNTECMFINGGRLSFVIIFAYIIAGTWKLWVKVFTYYIWLCMVCVCVQWECMLLSRGKFLLIFSNNFSSAAKIRTHFPYYKIQIYRSFSRALQQIIVLHGFVLRFVELSCSTPPAARGLLPAKLLAKMLNFRAHTHTNQSMYSNWLSRVKWPKITCFFPSETWHSTNHVRNI